jgi:hypothetical protein
MAIVRTRDPQDPLETLQEFIRQAEDSGLALVSLAQGLVQGQAENVVTFNFEPDILPAVQLKKLPDGLNDKEKQQQLASLIADEFSIISFSDVFDGGQLAEVAACRKQVGGAPGSEISEVPPERVFSDSELRTNFGDLKERPDPSELGAVIVDPQWAADNLVSVFIPVLKNLPFDAPGKFSGKATFHRRVAAHAEAAFAEIAEAGLSDRLLFWSGSFNPRHIDHNPKRRLSPHSWGVAFDLNDAQNPFGKTPAPIGAAGSLVELVPIFEKRGFYWGGRFAKKPDGMHFEYARPT